ncbi:hypothetical protein [Bartonella sp. AP58NXGY]|uniref:hypothetical protein n=1 Tax=Bartonella sp. AP58NXGY TaxID=3243498 RepID=UPI0035CEE5F1
MFNDVSKKAVSENILSKNFQIHVNFFIEGDDISLMGKVDCKEIFTVSWMKPFLKGKILDTIFAGR